MAAEELAKKYSVFEDPPEQTSMQTKINSLTPKKYSVFEDPPEQASMQTKIISLTPERCGSDF